MLFRKPEVDDDRLELVLAYLAHHDVFQLEVAMHDRVGVQVVDSRADLPEDGAELVGRAEPPLLVELQEIHGKQFHDDVDCGIRIVDPSQLADVRVVQPEGDQVLPLQHFLH